MRTLPALRTLSWSVLLFAAPVSAQAPDAVDEAAVAILKKHGLEQSQVMDHLSWMCDVYGPRLTGSPNIRRAQEWAVKTLAGWGLVNAHTEPWGPFGRGWRCERCAMEVIGDNPWPVIAYPKAWCRSLPGRVEAEVFLAAGVSAEDIKDMDLSNKIVFLDEPRAVNEPFDGVSKRFDATDLLGMADQAPASRPGRGGPPRPAVPEDPRKRTAMLRVLMAKKPLAFVDRGGKGDYGTVFVQGASSDIAGGGRGGGRRRGGPGEVGPPAEGATPPAAGGTPPPEGGAPPAPAPGVREKGTDVVPQFTMAVEHYNRICRLLKKNLPVRVAVELKTTFFEEDLMDRNVVAEIAGTDPVLGPQVVMLGGHFDSWHTGTGATDNGCGSAVAMEAVRLIRELIKETGKGPRRTIRIGLWSGEEEGLLGSRAYVREHFGDATPGLDGPVLKPEHALLAGYFNLDNGTGKVRGVYLQGNAAVAPIFRAWLRPFHTLGASTVTLNDTGGTDHLSFHGVGLPGFQFIQDPVSYDTRTHHSNMDVWDHVVAEDLAQAATIEASFVWHTAQRDELLPRPAPRAEGGGRRGNRGGVQGRRGGVVDAGLQDKAWADVRTIAAAVMTYQLRNAGAVPESLDALTVKDARGNAYLDQLDKDPWGQEYQLRRTNPGWNQAYVVSFGPDKREDTEDDVRSDSPERRREARRETVQRAYRERAGWTEDARREDPIGYINYAMEELKKDVDKLKTVQNEFARVRAKLDEELKDKQRRVQTAASYLEGFKSKYNEAKEKNAFPVVVEDRKYTEAELVQQIKLTLAEKKANERVITVIESALKQQEDKRRQLAARITESQLKVSQLDSQKVILQADKLNNAGEEILKNVNDMLADNDVKIKEAESPIRILDDIAKASAQGGDGKTAVMDKEVEEFLKRK